ncbi:MAG: response regulator [Betaproteobacteria bacterium]|nr:response regulator [Betaproteobacteria bacterium]
MYPATSEPAGYRNTTERIDILVVDDDETFGHVLARALGRRGLRFEIAQSFDEALELAGNRLPHRVILDLDLGGKNGLGLIEPLKRAIPDCRIVMLTGYASFDTAIDAIKRGATHYLAKPVDVDEILAAFEATGPQKTLPPIPGPVPLDRMQREHIQHTLKMNHYNITATARVLGMPRRTLQRKLTKQH